MNKIVIINGPNLNLLGKREKTIYGEISFEEYLEDLKSKFQIIEIEYFQSNSEADIINKLHECNNSNIGIIINPGAFGHTSIAIADAISSISSVCVEVHISNVYAREVFRHHSMISSKCIGTISGFGLLSYQLGVEALLNRNV